MGIISYLVIIITFYLLSLAVFPLLLKLILNYTLNAKNIHIKFKTPLKLKGLFLRVQQIAWGIHSLGVYIPQLNISFDVSKFRFVVKLTKPLIMLTKDIYELIPVKLIDGTQQHNIIFNLLLILKKYKKKEKKKQTGQVQSNRISIALKAGMNFLMMMALQFIQVRLQHSQIILVSHIPNDTLKFQNLRQITSSITMMQCFTQLSCSVPQFTLKTSIKNNYEWNIDIGCPFMSIMTTQHMQNNLLQSYELYVHLALPLTFSFVQSIKRMSVQYQLQRVLFNTVPKDFQQISLIINSFFFSPFQQESEQVNIQEQKQGDKQKQKQKQGKSSIKVKINQIQLKLRELYEEGHDEKETQNSLTNIQEASLMFRNIRLGEKEFKIDKSSLCLERYIHNHNQTHTHTHFDYRHSETQRKSKVRKNEVLNLHNLQISKETKAYEICHDDVKIYCQKEEIALFGKLFRIINNRMRRQEYDVNLYNKYAQVINPQMSLQQIIIKCSCLENAFSQNNNNYYYEQRVIEYNVRNIELQMDISQLVHKVNLQNINYKQKESSRYKEINHELLFHRINMQYKGIKEFHVSDFKLFYKQSKMDNELSIFVDDIHMVQNFNTLKDYLIGFTIFKQLLQFTNDEMVQENTNNQNTHSKAMQIQKTNKKVISVNKVMINYSQEILIIRKLLIDKQLSAIGNLIELYFSLGKCEFVVDKITQTNKALKYPINTSHTMLSISSITMKTYLIQYKNNNNKNKSLLHVKNPTFILPQIDISNRLVNYIKTYYDLRPYLQAYIKNVTNQKLKNYYKNYNVFLTQPDIYVIKITNILLGVQDTYLDKAMLNKMRASRQYYRRQRQSTTNAYIQSQLISNIKQTVKPYNLCQIKINIISIQINPIKELSSPQSVRKWTQPLKAYSGNSNNNNRDNDGDDQFNTSLKVIPSNSTKTRLIKAQSYQFKFQVKEVSLNVRDYPLQIFYLSILNGCIKHCRSKNIYQQNEHCVMGEVQIGDSNMNTGLCYLSGYMQIYKKLNRFIKATQEYQNTRQFLETIKLNKDLNKSKYKPYWHIIHKSSFWEIKIHKKTASYIRILTSISPYQTQQYLQIKVDPLSLQSNPIHTELILHSLTFYHKQFMIFELGKQIITLKTIYNQPDILLNIQTQLLPQHDNQIVISDKLIQYIQSIKQFRKDWLLLYGFVESKSEAAKKNEFTQQKYNYNHSLTYLEIARIAANNKLKEKETQLTIFSVLKSVVLNCKINSFFLQFMNKKNHISLILNEFTTKFETVPENDSWKMYGFYLNLKTIVGRLIEVDGKRQSKIKNKEFLRMYNSVMKSAFNVQQILMNNSFHQIFIVCRNLRYKLNQFHQFAQNTQNNTNNTNSKKEIYFINKKLVFESIKVQISAQLKQTIDSLSIAQMQVQSQGKQQQKQEIFMGNQLKPIEKFRQGVYMVMRINRRKKRAFKRIKCLILINKIQLVIKTPKHMVMLGSKKPSYLTYNVSYIPYDKYHIDPLTNIDIQFKQLQLWIKEDRESLWIFKESYSPGNYFKSNKILQSDVLHFQYKSHQNKQLPKEYKEFVKKIDRSTYVVFTFNNGVLHLLPQTIQVLKEVTDFFVMMFNTNTQTKNKEIDNYSQKYADLVKNGKQAIKNKLMWRFSDMRKKGPPTLQSKVNFVLNKFNIILQTRRLISGGSIPDAFIKIQSSQLSFQMQVFTNGNINRSFHITNLTVINLRQKEQDPYCQLIQMNHEENLAIFITMEQCNLNSSWNFTRLAHIHLNPIKIKVTQQIYTELYNFLFGNQHKELERQKQYSNEEYDNLPDYYLQIVIDEVNVKVWYRTQSIIKRLDGVTMGLQRYQLSQELLSKKKLFDKWIKFVLKQAASQFFNVISQKLFG